MPVPLNTPACAGLQGHRTAATVLVALALIGSGAVMRAHADDRPFLRTTHAMAGDDEDGWETSSTLVHNRLGSALSLQLEHDLNATHRLEVEWGHASRSTAPEPERGLRLRSLWVSPAQAGWGLATKVGIEPGRDGASGTRQQALAVASLPLLQERLWLHANLGWQWQSANASEGRRSTLGSLAAHWVLPTQQWLYAESARSDRGQDRFTQLGLRQWLRPRKLALDTGWGRMSGPAQPANVIAINLSFFDLNF